VPSAAAIRHLQTLLTWNGPQRSPSHLLAPRHHLLDHLIVIASNDAGIDDAVRIYARMLRAWLGSIGGAQAAREAADRLRAKGDWSGGDA
jgi:hypothetical protein